MNARTLPSRHMSQNSSNNGLKPNTLPLGHGGSYNMDSLRVSGEKTFVSLKHEYQSGVQSRDLWLSRQAALTTTPGPPPMIVLYNNSYMSCACTQSSQAKWVKRTAHALWSLKLYLKVSYHPLYSMNKFVTNKSKLPQDGAPVFPYMGWLTIMWPSERVTC